MVDDSPLDVELIMLAAACANLSEHLMTLRDGAEALDYLFARGAFAGRSSGDPVALLLDLQMPGVDGFDVLKTIRTTPSLSDLPVVVLTSSLNPGDAQRARVLGIDEVIVKSFDFAALVRDIARLGKRYLA